MGVIRKSWRWFESRTGIARFIGPVARHRVPKTGKMGWFFVFGSATLVAFLMQGLTGISLATTYVNSTADAYPSLQYITDQAPLGSLVRGMHNYGATAMTVLVGVHMVRVFLMGSYKFPREVNWLSGVILLVLTLGMGFTGQLLRWDQNAIWSVVVGAEQAGRTPFIGDWLGHFILAGDTLSGETLSRFFSLHVFLLPGLIFVVVSFHLYLVLRNGISTVPESGQPVDPKTYHTWYRNLLKHRGEPFWPDAAYRDIIFGVLVIIAIIALALVLGPPELGRPPDPTIIKADPKPDWYFLWYFSILAMVPASSESFIILLFPFIIGLVLILLPFIANKGERTPLRRPWAVAIVLVAVVAIGVLIVVGQEEPWVPQFDATPLPQTVAGPNPSPSIQAGITLFNQKGCLYCHKIDGNGGIRGPDLSEVRSHLTIEQIKVRVLTGALNMPAYGTNLSAQELNELLAFLETRVGNKTPRGSQ